MVMGYFSVVSSGTASSGAAEFPNHVDNELRPQLERCLLTAVLE
jgi:hypothetical protein